MVDLIEDYENSMRVDPVSAYILELINTDDPDDPMNRLEMVNLEGKAVNRREYINVWKIRVGREQVTPNNWNQWMGATAQKLVAALEAHFSVMGLKFDWEAMPDRNGKGCWGYTVALHKGRLTIEQEKLSREILEQQKNVRNPVHTIATRLVDGLVAGKEFCTVDMCVDFDGVIHIHPVTTPHDVVAGVPVEGVMDMLQLYKQRYSIAIYSSRSAIMEGRDAMKQFIGTHATPAFAHKLQYPDHKPKARWYFDDQAIRIDGPFFPSIKDLEERFGETWYKRPKGEKRIPAPVASDNVGLIVQTGEEE